MSYRKRIKATLALLFSCFLMTNATAEGIHFDNKLSWKALKEKARKEHKYILMDCQTTWCGWCRKMEKDVFENEQAGEFFNANFIPVSVQFDQDPDKDNDYVKSWYNDAKQIQKEYPLGGYPTCLIFAPDGQLVHRIEGYLPVKEFIAAGRSALTPDGQYYTLLKKYEAGEQSPAFLMKFIRIAQQAGFTKEAAKAFNQYYPNIKDPYTKDNLTLIAENISNTQDKGFGLFLNNTARVDEILGPGVAARKLGEAILGETMSFLSQNKSIDLDSLEAIYRSKYPNVHVEEPYAELKLQAAAQQKEKFFRVAQNYWDKHTASIDPSQISWIAWNISSMYGDSTTLRTSLGWCKAIMDTAKVPDPGIISAYSALLYKLGEKQAAITWMEKAADSVPRENRKQFESIIAQMKKDENIWQSH
ncbi:thioredoxin family protein [Chitinophaga polysaccharea]|uniref:thioredoxin family protein n=1 Tax=Chitinophaga polysaccharea TaxID=1293035 RepID=UPI001159E5C6|nr:thioredoxin family protein [Chitinophaga polysaccharea]